MPTLDTGILGLVFSAIVLLGNSTLIAGYTADTASERFWAFVASIEIQLGIISTATSIFVQLTPLGWLIAQSLVVLTTLFLLGYFANLPIRFSSFGLSSRISGDCLRRVESFFSSLPPITLFLLGCIMTPILLSGLLQYARPISHQVYFDERMYHASRVAYWLQNQSVFPYITHNDRQIVLPYGAELFFLWPLLFTSSELVARMVFWLGFPLAGIGLYLLLRALSMSRHVSMVGTLIFLATPVVLKYSVGLKPSMWLSFFVLGTAFWLVQYNQHPLRINRNLFLSGLFLMLSVNVRSTALALLLPALALPCLCSPKKNTLLKCRFIVLGLIAGLVLSGLVVPFGFNLFQYGHILGPAAMRNVHTSDISLTQLYTHTIRLPFLLFEPPTVPLANVRDGLTDLGNHLISLLSAERPLPGESSDRWPGLYRYTVTKYATKFSLGGVIWLPLLIIGLSRLVQNVRETYPYIQLQALSSLTLLDLSLLGGVVLLIRWQSQSGLPERFLIEPYALSLAIGIPILHTFTSNYRTLKVLAILLVVWMVLPSINLQLRATKAAIVSPMPKRELTWPFTEALSYIPVGSRILFVGNQDAQDYPLFSRNNFLGNRVIPWGKRAFSGTRMQGLLRSHEVTHVLIQDDKWVHFHWDPPLSTIEMVAWLENHSGFSEIPLATKGQRLFEAIEMGKSMHPENSLEPNMLNTGSIHDRADIVAMVYLSSRVDSFRHIRIGRSQWQQCAVAGREVYKVT